MKPLVKIGVSACLLGEHVRYDGGHKYNRSITETLGEFFTLVSVCPEVGCGLPVPREAMQLEGGTAAPRLMTIHTRIDKTEQMLTFCSIRVKELESIDISGFVFKERSPSCGLSSVPLHDNAAPGLLTVGLFAAAVAGCFQQMPTEEAERLENPMIRKTFIESVLQYSHEKNARRKDSGDNPPQPKTE